MAGRAPGGPEAGKPSGGGGSFPYRRGSEGPSQVPKAAAPDTLPPSQFLRHTFLNILYYRHIESLNQDMYSELSTTSNQYAGH